MSDFSQKAELKNVIFAHTGQIDVEVFVMDQWGAESEPAKTQVTVNTVPITAEYMNNADARLALKQEAGDVGGAFLGALMMANGLTSLSRRSTGIDVGTYQTKVLNTAKTLWAKPVYASKENQVSKCMLEQNALAAATISDDAAMGFVEETKKWTSSSSMAGVRPKKQGLECLTSSIGRVLDSFQSNKDARIAARRVRRNSTSNTNTTPLAVVNTSSVSEAASSYAQAQHIFVLARNVAAMNRRQMADGVKQRNLTSSSMLVSTRQFSQNEAGKGSTAVAKQDFNGLNNGTFVNIQLNSNMFKEPGSGSAAPAGQVALSNLSSAKSVAMTVVQYEKPIVDDVSGKPLLAKTVSIELSAGDEQVAVSGLERKNAIQLIVPFVGVIPVKVSGTNPQGPKCLYYDETGKLSWNDDGLSLTAIRCKHYADQSHPQTTATQRFCHDGYLRCSTSHLSVFSAKTGSVTAYNSVDPFADYSGLIDIGKSWLVISAVSLVYLIYGGSMWYGRHVDQKATRRIRRLHYFGYSHETEDSDNPEIEIKGESKWGHFKRMVKYKMKNEHKWANVIYDESIESTSRPMKITLLFSVTLGAFVVCAMFYKTDSSSGEVKIEIDILRSIMVGVMGTVLVAPPTFVFGYGFDYAAKQSRLQHKLKAFYGAGLSALAGSAQSGKLSLTPSAHQPPLQPPNTDSLQGPVMAMKVLPPIALPMRSTGARRMPDSRPGQSPARGGLPPVPTRVRRGGAAATYP